MRSPTAPCPRSRISPGAVAITSCSCASMSESSTRRATSKMWSVFRPTRWPRRSPTSIRRPRTRAYDEVLRRAGLQVRVHACSKASATWTVPSRRFEAALASVELRRHRARRCARSRGSTRPARQEGQSSAPRVLPRRRASRRRPQAPARTVARLPGQALRLEAAIPLGRDDDAGEDEASAEVATRRWRQRFRDAGRRPPRGGQRMAALWTSRSRDVLRRRSALGDEDLGVRRQWAARGGWRRRLDRGARAPRPLLAASRAGAGAARSRPADAKSGPVRDSSGGAHAWTPSRVTEALAGFARLPTGCPRRGSLRQQA